MKKITLILAITICLGITTYSQSLMGFNQTETGLHYKFYIKTDNPRAQIGDIIVAEIWVYLDNKLEYAIVGTPEPLFQVVPSQRARDLMDALKMIGRGDSVRFAFCAETFRKHNPNLLVDPDAQFLFYTIKVDGVYTEEEFEVRMEEERIRGEAEEAIKLAAFIAEQKIIVEPNADGVFVIIEKVGTGNPVRRGGNVKINYVVRLLNGKLFDTNIEDIARANNILNPRLVYEPLAFEAGVGRVIPGIDNTLLGMRIGTRATLIVPSNMAYGMEGIPSAGIPPFTTLIFYIEIVDFL